MREDEAAVVDVVEERPDVEQPERALTVELSRHAVETHAEPHGGKAFGTAAQLRRTSVPSLTTQVFSCTPDFGPGTSAPRSLRVRVGLHRLFS